MMPFFLRHLIYFIIDVCLSLISKPPHTCFGCRMPLSPAHFTLQYDCPTIASPSFTVHGHCTRKAAGSFSLTRALREVPPHFLGAATTSGTFQCSTARKCQLVPCCRSVCPLYAHTTVYYIADRKRMFQRTDAVVRLRRSIERSTEAKGSNLNRSFMAPLLPLCSQIMGREP